MHPADHPGPLVFVHDLDRPHLADDDRHHLERVLRIRQGSELTISDGAGRWRTALLDREVVPTGQIELVLEPTPLTIGFALVKGAKPEVIVQKLTELGVDRIVPFEAERSIVRWDEARARKAIVRLRAVARAAAMQSHRARLPVVDDVTALDLLVRESGAALTDREGGPPSVEHRVLLVGPEGGWAPGELRNALPRVCLGEHVLRAETAAITAGALLTALRNGIVGRIA